MAGQESFAMAKKKSAAPETTSQRAAVPAPRKRTSAGARPKAHNGDTRHDPTHAEIAEAAYLRYLSRQGSGGSEFDDWVEAERDLRRLRSAATPKSS
jgi:hypothetical protein